VDHLRRPVIAHAYRRGDPVWNDDPATIDQIVAEIAAGLS
jgi:hypothetical protein